MKEQISVLKKLIENVTNTNPNQQSDSVPPLQISDGSAQNFDVLPETVASAVDLEKQPDSRKRPLRDTATTSRKSLKELLK